MSSLPPYVPVLRTHRAEHDALREVSSEVRRRLMPLIEVSGRFERQIRDLPPIGIARKVVTFAVGSAGTGPLYIELGRILEENPEADAICNEIERRILTLHSKAQLVFRVADFTRGGIRNARELLRRNGAGFRITSADYASPRLNELFRFLRLLDLEFQAIDLLIDSEVVSEGCVLGNTALSLQNDYSWRSLTYIGGSFPENLSNFPKNNEYELPRHEWQSFALQEKELRTRVRYGDYTVQHPHQKELAFLPSASIRYASDTYWVVMRGEKPGKPDGPGTEQYIGHAQLLRLRPEYCGSDFSAGDAYIDFIASQDDHSGNSTKWIQAAVNHHITLTARQLPPLLAA